MLAIRIQYILVHARRNESKWKQPFQNDKNLNQQDSNKESVAQMSPDQQTAWA